jgi:hypothetical protein
MQAKPKLKKRISNGREAGRWSLRDEDKRKERRRRRRRRREKDSGVARTDLQLN